MQKTDVDELDGEMLPEYDFTKDEIGKYVERYARWIGGQAKSPKSRLAGRRAQCSPQPNL